MTRAGRWVRVALSRAKAKAKRAAGLVQRAHKRTFRWFTHPQTHTPWRPPPPHQAIPTDFSPGGSAGRGEAFHTTSSLPAAPPSPSKQQEGSLSGTYATGQPAPARDAPWLMPWQTGDRCARCALGGRAPGHRAEHLVPCPGWAVSRSPLSWERNLKRRPQLWPEAAQAQALQLHQRAAPDPVGASATLRGPPPPCPPTVQGAREEDGGRHAQEEDATRGRVRKPGFVESD